MITNKFIKNLLEKTTKAVKLHKKTYIDKKEHSPIHYPILWKKVIYKEYPRFPFFKLPLIKKLPKIDLYRTIVNRVSTRIYSQKSLELFKLSEILYFSAGVKNVSHNKLIKRMYPSSGGRYPLEIYLIALRNIEKLSSGLYHYNVKYHGLEKLPGKIIISEFKQCLTENNETIAETASIVIVITAVFPRIEVKYVDRAYRFINLEAGHIAQNLVLSCTGNNIKSCLLGGYIDKKINRLLDLEEEKEQSIYLIALGY